NPSPRTTTKWTRTPLARVKAKAKAVRTRPAVAGVGALLRRESEPTPSSRRPLLPAWFGMDATSQYPHERRIPARLRPGLWAARSFRDDRAPRGSLWGWAAPRSAPDPP